MSQYFITSIYDMIFFLFRLVWIRHKNVDGLNNKFWNFIYNALIDIYETLWKTYYLDTAYIMA